MRYFWLVFRDTFEIIVIALTTVFIIRSFLIQPFLVSGASMEPNFSNGNYLLIDEIAYNFRNPQRGEIIVFRYPNDQSVYFIKRIIGLPGERIVIKNSQIFINNLPLKEAYLSSWTQTEGGIDTRLDSNEYFVLGDNRSYSFDSRNWGPIKENDIIGLVRLRIFPLAQIKAFNY